jgi:lactoylglutathione lyase
VLSAPRWTHVALPVADLDRTIDWYERYTPLQLIDRRVDDLGQGAWLAHPEATAQPFVLVLVMFNDRRGTPQPQLAPFAHLGIELLAQADVDAVAARARADGCLAWEPQQLPPPVGYVCAATDPDGNVVEFSFDQGVAAKVLDAFGPA